MAGKIEFVPTEADYASASRANYRCQLRTVAMWRRLAILIVAAGVLYLVVLGAIYGEVGDLMVPVAIGLGIGVLFLFPIILLNYVMLGRRARRLFHQQRTLHQPQELEWTDERLLWRGTGFAIDMKWRDYHRWHESRDQFLLFLNEQMPQFIPRHALDEARAADLRATLVAHGPPRR